MYVLYPPNQQKQKYELVTGQWKSSEELISIYTALLDAQPGVVGFIEPLHHMVWYGTVHTDDLYLLGGSLCTYYSGLGSRYRA